MWRWRESRPTVAGAFPPRSARTEKPFDSCTRAKQFARSSPHKKKGRLTTDSFFNVWRWRDREYAYRPRLKIFSSKNFGLATDSLILFANKMMLRRSIPARKPSSWLAHLHIKKPPKWGFLMWRWRESNPRAEGTLI